MGKKEHYRTRGSLANSIGIDLETLDQRLQSSGIKPKEREGYVGDLKITHRFYPEAEVRELFKDLLEGLPQADEKGLLTKEGVSYGTRTAIARALGIGGHYLNARVASSTLRPIRGKDISGQIHYFYPESEVRELCKDIPRSLPDDYPRAYGSGLLILGDTHYRTVSGLVRPLGFTYSAISRRINSSSLEPVKGYVGGAPEIRDFYPVEEVRKLCADLIAKKSKK